LIPRWVSAPKRLLFFPVQGREQEIKAFLRTVDLKMLSRSMRAEARSVSGLCREGRFSEQGVIK